MENGLSAGYWHFFMAELVWRPGTADALLRQVADDVVSNVLFVSAEQATVFAPYDGGADVFLTSAFGRDMLRNRYAARLSSHPQGL